MEIIILMIKDIILVVIACKFCSLSDISGDKINSQYMSV